MMFKFSKTSQDKLNTCHPDLIRLMEVALKTSPMDFSIICGHRGEKEQNEAVKAGTSKLDYPHGKHNKLPSLAVDIAPYPIDWNDLQRFADLAKHIKKTANNLDISIWWGGDWRALKDFPHYELLSW